MPHWRAPREDDPEYGFVLPINAPRITAVDVSPDADTAFASVRTMDRWSCIGPQR
jgi:hypothetical protein